MIPNTERFLELETSDGPAIVELMGLLEKNRERVSDDLIMLVNRLYGSYGMSFQMPVSGSYRYEVEGTNCDQIAAANRASDVTAPPQFFLDE